MTAKRLPTTHPRSIDGELDAALAQGPLRDIVVPACPQMLLALRQVMAQPDPEIDEVAAIAACDVAMAASLIRTANSPFYARQGSVASVPEATRLLGLRMAERMLGAFLVRQAVPATGPLLEHFWETSQRRALAMAHIAGELRALDADLAYACGLFCHVGIPVLMQGVRGYASTLAQALERKDRSFCATENAAHHTDHAVVGALVARTWALPTEIVQAVRLHHDFSVLAAGPWAREVVSLVAMSAVAEYLVADFEGVGPQHEWLEHGAQCLAHLHIHPTEVNAWIDALHPLLQSVSLD
ncbi:MAG: HDOD domain-containing protein [Rhodoferax sp.]